ncbi:MAG: DUF2520 domain-containing protein [Terriglobales bacterium]
MTGKPIDNRTAGPSVAIIGAGRLATFLAVALRGASFLISEIVARDSKASVRTARKLAAKVGARAVTANSAVLDAKLLWFCVPDREIRRAASALADRLRPAEKHKCLYAFHSSGALLSGELDPLRKAGAAIASVHPLMTFVAGANPSLKDVPFALEGDAAAIQVARRIVRQLGGQSFLLPAKRKAAYHAWATMTSPLFLAFLVTLEEAARVAGFARDDARRKSLPIIRQTLANYSRLGPARSFSGPLIRGDSEIVATHLRLLKKNSKAREVYATLARVALQVLPIKNRKGIEKLLQR